MARPAPHNAGLSLPECLAVLSVLAVLAALTLPALNPLLNNHASPQSSLPYGVNLNGGHYSTRNDTRGQISLPCFLKCKNFSIPLNPTSPFLPFLVEISFPPFQLPGIKELVYFAPVIRTPISDGINYLLRADSLMGADEALSADIHDKTGDLYLWQGLPSYAAVHYQQSVDLLPVNSSVRNKLIDVYDGLYQFGNAFINLDTLATRNELIFEKQVLYCKYFVHAGNYDAAAKYLADADSVYPYVLPELKDLFGRMYLLSGNYKKALSYYREYLEIDPK